MASKQSGKKKSKRPTLKQRRRAKTIEIHEVLESLETKLTRVKTDLKQVELLKSVADGLYDEMDKLSKKAPADFATDLVVTHVNDVIKEARQLAADDAYVQRIHEFVPAGDNPEHRDVILILRQVRQGLDRCHGEFESRDGMLTRQIATANGFIVALTLYVEHDVTYPSVDELSANDAALADRWLSGNYRDKHVALERIDRLDVASHFAADS